MASSWGLSFVYYNNDVISYGKTDIYNLILTTDEVTSPPSKFIPGECICMNAGGLIPSNCSAVYERDSCILRKSQSLAC